ncbi:hypothetical protein [Actinomycetospora sp. TBRC 11914]|uniref:hypothetical protein n=1 Tax=Actinomycetospora sp. TBRC 11914 TaxID=2729387 RepID=UPI00145E4A01|nr:hypothetical protein [Actinomycetospora sp. TBRC 11914]NMO93932.1 hypothetical protein [Actinomycetospora sp. TBRC 11914]
MGAEESFEALATEQLAVPGVTRRSMFGRDTLLVDGHPYAFRDGERVTLKHPAAGELVAAGRGVVPVMGSRAMRGWVAVPLGSSSLSGLAELAAAARGHLAS